MAITPIQINSHFSEVKKLLLHKVRRQPLNTVTRDMNKQIGPGVYFLYDYHELIYVGESGNLFGRMKDLNRTLNHTFRRSLGEAKYSTHKKYFKASSKKKFDVEIELLLDEYVQGNITVSYLHIDIGRKEFEEWMQEKNPTIKWLNKRGRRK